MNDLAEATTDRVLAIISARGGSKGLPGKNLAKIGDYSLVAHAARAARDAGSVDRLIITTDDGAIAASAKEAGAEVPFMRPVELALDSTPGIAPVRHAVSFLENLGERFRWIVLLQPTSPLRTGEDIANAIALAKQHNADKVIGVTAVHQQPSWMFSLDEPTATLHRFLPPSDADKRRQTLPKLFAANGAVYVYSRDAVFADESAPQRVHGYVMPPERSIDIDSAWDLTVARLIYAHLQQPQAK